MVFPLKEIKKEAGSADFPIKNVDPLQVKGYTYDVAKSAIRWLFGAVKTEEKGVTRV
jgi:hypothetical protein